jgi:hypothetical protein
MNRHYRPFIAFLNLVEIRYTFDWRKRHYMSLQKIPVEQNLDKSTPNQIVVSPTTTFFGGVFFGKKWWIPNINDPSTHLDVLQVSLSSPNYIQAIKTLLAFHRDLVNNVWVTFFSYKRNSDDRGILTLKSVLYKSILLPD